MYVKFKEMRAHFNQEYDKLQSSINDHVQQVQSENLMLRSHSNALQASVDQQKTENAG